VIVYHADKLASLLMDIYACQGDVDKAELLMRRSRRNIVQLTVLVKLLGKRNMAVGYFLKKKIDVFVQDSQLATRKSNSACIDFQRNAPTH
jgi:hypothetical protein